MSLQSPSRPVYCLLAAAVLIGAMACAGTTPRQQYERHKLLVQAAVQVGVSSVLRDHRAWAAPLARAVQEARAALTTETVDLTQLITFVTARLNLHLLTPEEHVLVHVLATAIQGELSALLADPRVALPPDTQTLAIEVLGWVEAVAVVYQAQDAM